MQKKKSMNSNRRLGRPTGSGPGKTIPGTTFALSGTAHGEDPKLNIYPPEVPDYEVATEEPDDDLSLHKFPPPKKNPKFRSLWGQYIDSIVRRDNFNIGHLNVLEIFCDLLVEYHEVSTFIRKKGRSYQSLGRSGTVWKLYPEVVHLKSVQHHINVYMKQLGLTLRRDEFGISGTESDEWS